MTEHIPPLPGEAHMPPPPPPPLGGGGYPPPPPPSGGYLPPPPGPAVRGLTKESYTPWLSRVAAYAIDHLPVALVFGVGYLVLLNSVDQICSVGYSTVGLTVMTIALLLGLAYMVWNFGYRQGATGSSVGKSLLRFKVVSENTGKPIGFGLSVLREITHLVDAAIIYIGYLFPLWDAKRQTLADKIMATVCLPLDAADGASEVV